MKRYWYGINIDKIGYREDDNNGILNFWLRDIVNKIWVFMEEMKMIVEFGGLECGCIGFLFSVGESWKLFYFSVFLDF